MRFDTNLFYSEDFCFVMDCIAEIESFDLLKVHDYIYCIIKEDVNRAQKYKMNFDELGAHYEAHKVRFEKLENICGDKLMGVRSDVYHRLFNNFWTFVRSLNDRKICSYQVGMFKRAMKDEYFYNCMMSNHNRKAKLFYKWMIIVPDITFYLIKLLDFVRK